MDQRKELRQHTLQKLSRRKKPVRSTVKRNKKCKGKIKKKLILKEKNLLIKIVVATCNTRFQQPNIKQKFYIFPYVSI